MTASHDVQILVHQEQPRNAEPAGTLLRSSFLTAQEHFFVRTHGSIPMIDQATYRLRITGMVEHIIEMSVEELKSIASVRTVTATLQCAGNRRDELIAMKSLGEQVPWKSGAISTATWRGVPLREVLNMVGVKAGAQHVAFTSFDKTSFEREQVSYGGSISLEKALSADVLLAYEMNDEPLTPAHGFPLRALVPGYIGARSVKWLQEIIVQDHVSTNPYQARDYKVFPPEVTAETADWSQGKMLEELALNAVITRPKAEETLATGVHHIQGFAIASAGAPVERVEISIDGGQSWIHAPVIERADPYAWCFWDAVVHLASGKHQVIVRAWDTLKQTQPENVEDVWNFKGYMNTAWQRVTITVS